MKLTVIHGQTHQGSTYHLAHLLMERFQEPVEVSEFFLPQALPHFCLGCYRCIEEEQACPFYKEKQVILQSIQDCDLMIFTTPTYCMRASAPMKSFIDLTFTNWFPHKPKPWMFQKKAVILSTSAGTGTKHAIKDIATCLFYWGVPYIRSYGQSIQAMNWEGVAEKKKKKLQNDMANLARKIERVDAVHVGIKTKVYFELMRAMQKANWGSSPIEKQYWEEQGWLGRHRPWKKRSHT